MRVRVISSVVAAAALLTLAGCGSGDKKEAATTTTTAVVVTTPTSTPRTFTGEGSEAFCEIARANITKIREVPSAVSSQADLQALLAEVAPDVRAAVDVAPAEIKPTVTVLADGFERLVAGDYTIISDPAFGAAGVELQDYGRQVCGLTG